MLFVVSGPAGSGKTTLCERLLAEFPSFKRAVTATTRSPRPGEKQGVDYYFFSTEDFERTREENGFLEFALVHGRAYGTLQSEVDRHLTDGFDVLLNIDVQGMRQIRERFDKIETHASRLITIFIMPPSLDELRARLEKRQSDDSDEISRRMATAENEIQTAGEFDYILETGERAWDYERARAIYLAEQMRQK